MNVEIWSTNISFYIATLALLKKWKKEPWLEPHNWHVIESSGIQTSLNMRSTWITQFVWSNFLLDNFVIYQKYLDEVLHVGSYLNEWKYLETCCSSFKTLWQTWPKALELRPSS